MAFSKAICLVNAVYATNAKTYKAGLKYISPLLRHIRPVCILAARLLLEKENLVLTFFSPPQEFEQVRKDITSQFAKSLIPSDVQDKALKRIRLVLIVTTYKSTDVDGFDAFTPFFQSYPAAYETLYHSRPFTCATTGEVFGAIPPPVAVILDLCSFPQCQATRALSGTSVPVIIVLPAPSSAIIRAFGPESLGGIGDLKKRADDEAARLGVSSDEAADKLFNRTEGKILKIAGLPAMYDHEFFPQELPYDQHIGSVIRGGIQFLNECDAVLISSSHFYEDTSLTQLKSWFKSLSKNPPVYAIGPLLPPEYGRHSMERSGFEENQVERDLDIFLTEMQSKYGEKSVIFISFGTNCWPTVPEYIDEVIQALIEREIPFVLCHASPVAKVPEEIASNINVSRLGFLAPWVPQQYILNHPATGWFLTHCGNGSVTESLGSGIPMICWPFSGDQPSTSAHLSCNLKVAIELFEVRTGPHGLKPVLRNGVAAKGTREAVGKEFREVLDACRSKRGEELRKNAEEMKWKYQRAWDNDGEAKRGLNAFLERHV